MSSLSAPSPLSLPRPAGVSPVAGAEARPLYGPGFVLFILLNATLFVRPAEIVPALIGVEIYQALILACLLASFPGVLEQLTPRSLERRPATVCVLGLFVAVLLSHLAHGEVA